MRILAGLLLGALCSVAAANPYLDLPTAELRQRMAAIADVHKEKWYQVEVLVFARSASWSREYWRLDRSPMLAPENGIHPDEETVLLPPHADPLAHDAAALGAWQLLPSDRLILGDMLGRMVESGDYRVLYHGGWVQPVRERSVALPIYLSGGDEIPLATASDAVLDLAGIEAGLPPLEPVPAARSGPDLEPVEAPFGEDYMAPATQRELQGMLRLHLARYLHVEPELWFTSVSAEGQRFRVSIDQSRRMRSGELHYLDHPLFGLLIRLTPHRTEGQQELELLEQALKAR